MNPPLQRVFGSVLGAAAGSDGPWRAKTVLLALFIVVLGLGFWVRDAVKGPPPPSPAHVTTPTEQAASGGSWDFSRPVPGYARVCASYIGGFFIGWAVRRFLRLALSVVILALLLVGVARYAGCDAAPAQSRVKEKASWARHEAVVARDYLKGFLPSGTAGAVGVFLGFWRRDRSPAPIPDPPTDSH